MGDWWRRWTYPIRLAALSLGLGIGANTAFFTILKAALYGAPPLYQGPDRQVNIWETAPREPGP